MMAVLVGFMVIGMTAAAFVLGMAASFWWAYWMYPLWGILIVPTFGLKPVSFWLFWALWIFIRTRPPELDTDKPKETKSSGPALIAWALLTLCSPPITYYLLRWMAS